MRDDSTGSVFTVDLGGLRLPPILEQRVDTEIKSAVLSALAELKIPDTRSAIDFKHLVGEIRGLYAVPNKEFLQGLNQEWFAG